MIVVVDTGPIIHLSEADALSLLDSFEELLIPDTVIGELERGGTPAELRDRTYTVVTANEAAIEADLDPGERAAIAVASERDAVLLTDDLAARNVAESNDLETHGSIGVILYGHTQGVLDTDSAKQLLRALATETTLYLSPALLDHAIDLVDERDGWQ